MAKKAAAKNEKSMEETLWASANKLRGTVESSEYKHVVLGLIFLKFASDKFEERRKELIEEGKEKYLEMKEFYNMKNIFILNKNIDSIHIKDFGKPIITNLIPAYIFLSLVGIIFLCIGIFLLPIVLVLSIPVILFMAIYKENLRKPLLYIFALITFIIFLLQYLKIEIF